MIPFIGNDWKLTADLLVRRATQFLSQVFTHCERLGQVVTTDKSPRRIAAAPNEAKALEQDAARRPEIERERAMLGLEPRIETASPIDNVGSLSLADEAEPESIYASQFANMAKTMQDILAGNKKNQVSQEDDIPNHPGNGRGPAENVAPASQRNLDNGKLAPHQLRARDNAPADTLIDLAPVGGLPMGNPPGIKEPGLAKSRWTTPTQTTQASGQIQRHFASRSPQARRGHGVDSDLIDLASPRATAYAPAMGQPVGVSSSQSTKSAQGLNQATASPRVALNGRALDHEETSSLPAGQPWW